MTQLKRELGVFGATMMGLGAILGTGVFVSIGIAAGITGASVVIAIALSAFVAACNALNSAQLASNHPVSGGTYEYGYRYLNRWLGFTAGWTFLLAKSASGATAALGVGGYIFNALGITTREGIVPLGVLVVLVLTAIVFSGVRRSHVANVAIVSVTLLALGAFVAGGFPLLLQQGSTHFSPFFAPESDNLAQLLQATALMFVAYTGYGRIATMGEEVRNPRFVIPRAILVAMGVTMLIYMSVALVGVGTVGVAGLAPNGTSQSAPLELASRQFGVPLLPELVALGAITAMLGVLLNLILGLSRVLLAMGRRGDMPPLTATISPNTATPSYAVLIMGGVIALLVLVGNVKTTWSFSAFTVLIYYAITNLSALQLSDAERLYPRWLAWVGLGACLFLAFWVEVQVWVFGCGMIALGLVWHAIAHRLTRTR